MELTETVALYKRILALFPANKLQDKCNHILQEEIAPIDREVTELKKAFAKIDDIRDAVIKLEQGSTSTGIRSVSLLEVMDSTMTLQETLENALEKMAAGMTVDGKNSAKKRSRNEDSIEERKVTKHMKKKPGSTQDKSAERHEAEFESSASESSDSDSESTESESEEDSQGNRGGEALSRKVLVNETKGAADRGHVVPPESPAACFTAIVDEAFSAFSWDGMRRIIPEILHGLRGSVDDDTGCEHAVSVISSLQIIVVCARQAKGQRQYLDAYFEYSCSIQAYMARLPDSAQTDDFKRMDPWRTVKDLSTALDHLQAKATFAAGEVSERESNGFGCAVKEMDLLNHEKRAKNILNLVIAFKKETFSTVTTTHAVGLLRLLNSVADWMSKDPHTPVEKHKYRLLCQAMRGCADRVPNMKTKEFILSLRNKMLGLLSETKTNTNKHTRS